jgi:hypothetical protein
MKGDTIDRLLTFGLVYLVVAGGGIMLVAFGTVLDPLVVRAVIATIGSATQWAFNKETQKATARQQERALLTASPASNGITTVYPEQGTATVTVTQEPAQESNP